MTLILREHIWIMDHIGTNNIYIFYLYIFFSTYLIHLFFLNINKTFLSLSESHTTTI